VDQDDRSLSHAHRKFLLEVAREAIREQLDRGTFTLPTSSEPALNELRATFVTLRERDSRTLRGCRGEYHPTRPLIVAVARTAVASATDDPRFPAITPDELVNTSIEISVLGPLTSIAPDEIVVGRHGLLLKRGSAAGLLLPHVPVEQQWSRSEYLEWLARKAGLESGAWNDPAAELYAFETETWEEG
jgi:AmmeMemoRadiSam system protein A